MLPNPLHPAVVHLPIALAILLPAAALLAFFLRSRGSSWNHAWLPVVFAAAALALSSWAAVETGKDQEEVVERVVPEEALEEHEERGEVFLWGAVLVFLLVAAGLAPGKAGHVLRLLSAAAMAVLLFLGYRVGHAGGELVYRYGAAQAYTASSTASPDTATTATEPRRQKRKGRDDH
jgi:uncharacterized membrane protein